MIHQIDRQTVRQVAVIRQTDRQTVRQIALFVRQVAVIRQTDRQTDCGDSSDGQTHRQMVGQLL